MRNGCILNGGTGSGKSRTGIYYYFTQQGGRIGNHEYVKMKNPKDLYIITTAMKRDSQEFEAELAQFCLSTKPYDGYFYSNKIIIDSWNNIQKYKNVKGAFFILDEDRVKGSGVWVKAFLKIAANNDWILMSATPGDKYEDYIPVFIANGFYRNRTEFSREHLVYSNMGSFWKVTGYLNTRKLDRLRDRILIDMPVERETVQHHETVPVRYDIPFYRGTQRKRWDPFKDEPIEAAAGLCYVLRRIVNADESRQVAVLELVEDHPRVIIFYNFDYERDILLGLHYGDDVAVAEWSGHAHQKIPNTDKWVYLVQYTAGCEGWNCVKTDTIIFYSQTYSYTVLQQACGRIDRLNTTYRDLYYYHLRSQAPIDIAIARALSEKKKFNERKFLKW